MMKIVLGKIKFAFHHFPAFVFFKMIFEKEFQIIGDELNGTFNRGKDKETMELNLVDFVGEVFCLGKKSNNDSSGFYRDV